MRRVIPFSEIQDQDAAGGKARTLALLLQADFPVPPGFIITAEAFEPAMQGNEDPESWVFPESLRQEIETAYATYVAPPVVVRSSCSLEDMKSASYAGLYESVLPVTSDNLLDSIKRCWLSVYKDHARAYQRKFSKPDEAPAMSIIVQELVDADAAGVVFSQNPISGSEDEIVINASFGLGEAVVSGLVTPDLFILAKQDTTVLTRELGEKECKTVLDGDGTHLVETTAEQKSSFSLTVGQLQELKSITLAIETLLGCAVDLEFAYRQGTLYIVQARPITT